jgi:hypothetical protein
LAVFIACLAAIQIRKEQFVRRFHFILISAISALVVLPTAHASDHGCTVLMCLSNPAGPTAVTECVPPIKKLWRDLSKGRAFPSCDEADGADGKRSFVRQVRTHYAECSSGLRALESDRVAVLANLVSTGVWALAPDRVEYPGIGSGDDLSVMLMRDRPLPPKVCVGNLVPVVDTADGRSAEVLISVPYATRTVWAFDRVEVLEPLPRGLALDVYINGAFWQRTHG